MGKVILEVAGVALSFESHRLILEQRLLPLVSRKSPEIHVRHFFSDPPFFREKKLFYQRGDTYRFYRTQEGFLIETNPPAVEKELTAGRFSPPSDGIPKTILIDSSFKRASFFLGAKRKEDSFHLLWTFVYLLLSHLLLYRKMGIFVHASGVCDRNRGYLFVGPSGAGKSTVARLFEQKTKGSVLGDDIIAIWKGKGGPRIYGTPIFSTSSISPLKKGVPLRALFFLRHGRRNALKSLSPRDSLERFLSQTPSILWIPEALRFSAEFSFELCSSLPNHELSFVPDGTVVSFLRKSLP